VITLAGFHLLIKPEINFFLYARPEVILQRKRELDSQTIAGLNDKYLSLFGKFKKQYPNSTYQAVENLELETTLDSVFKTIVKQVA
jgi:thymidylate kinase